MFPRRRRGESFVGWFERVLGSKPRDRWILVALFCGLGVAFWFLQPTTPLETLLWPIVKYAFPVVDENANIEADFFFSKIERF